ncbi:MAG: enoyl-CoA hydratase-related protein [Candidatus Binatia bacterium]
MDLVAERSFANLHLERSQAVATIRLDRPAALNALDGATLRELARALRAVRRDEGVRALVVTGSGDKAFCAGADVAAMAAMSAQEGHAFSRLGHEVFARLEALPIPVVAALNGVALGGGLELALACDFIVAADRVRVGQPEINLGLIPGFGGTQRLLLRVGLARTRDLVYRGRMIRAEEAHAIGLVDRVVPAAELAMEAAKLAAELAEKAPVALRQAKRATRAAVEGVLAAGCEYEIEAFGVTFASEDRVEGTRAFLEKRPAAWKGR